MTDLRKAAEQTVTDLEELISWFGIRDSDDKLMPARNQTPEIKSAMESLEALRQALAQPDEVLAEREACAKLCEKLDDESYPSVMVFPSQCAAAIRARGQA